jgi:hypothetical protein
VSRAGLEPATLCLKGAWTASKASPQFHLVPWFSTIWGACFRSVDNPNRPTWNGIDTVLIRLMSCRLQRTAPAFGRSAGPRKPMELLFVGELFQVGDDFGALTRAPDRCQDAGMPFL